MDPDFVDLSTPEANAPMVLALASKGNIASGQMFNTSGFAASKF